MSTFPSTPEHRANEKREALLVGGTTFVGGVICIAMSFSGSNSSQLLLWLGLSIGLYGLVYLCIGFFAAPETCRKALRYVPHPF